MKPKIANFTVISYRISICQDCSLFDHFLPVAVPWQYAPQSQFEASVWIIIWDWPWMIDIGFSSLHHFSSWKQIVENDYALVKKVLSKQKFEIVVNTSNERDLLKLQFRHSVSSLGRLESSLVLFRPVVLVWDQNTDADNASVPQKLYIFSWFRVSCTLNYTLFRSVLHIVLVLMIFRTPFWSGFKGLKYLVLSTH